ncbi:hypothetical protein BK708_41740 [Bacillus thuringiensis serovar yunnanensis]|nr:hypothetical protein BK708_41740 [Bacillus thuringiensis serovar yunnanensis]
MNALIKNENKRNLILLIFGIILIAANLRAVFMGIGPLISQIHSDTEISNGLSGLLTTIPLIAFASISPITSEIARRFGVEKTLFISLITLSAGIFIRSIPSVYFLFIGTIIIGAGIAICNVLLPSVITRDFSRDKVGIMTGIYAISMGLFAAFTSSVSIPLSHSIGWRGALMLPEIFTILAVVMWLPQVSRKQKHPKIIEQVEKQVPHNVWSSKLAWYISLFMGLQSFGVYVTVAWLPAIFIEHGMSATSSAFMLTLIQFISLPVMFIAPIIAGHRKSQSFLVIIATLLGIIGYLTLFSSTLTVNLIGAALIGICQGANASLAIMFFSLRARNVQQSAALSGMAQSIGYIIAAIGPILFGELHDIYSTWTISIFVLIIFTVAQLAMGWRAGKDEYITKV